MKKTLIAFAILSLSGAAFANNTSTSTCNGTSACSPDQRANTTTVGDNRNGQIANGGSIANGANVQAYGGQGGRGGQGGAGGNATGGTSNSSSSSAATGGASTSTSNGGSSSASIAAGAVSINAGTHNASASGGSVGNTSAMSGGNTMTGGAVSVGGQSTTVGGQQTSTQVGGQMTSINIDQADNARTVEAARLHADALRDQKIRNVPNVSAAALTSSNDTCMGSASGGVSAPGFGVQIGSTYTDNNCVMLKNSRELWNMGMKAAAMALMCTDSNNRAALEMTGYVCPQSMKDKQTQSSAAAARNAGEPTDPIVRRRMGLPALAQ